MSVHTTIHTSRVTAEKWQQAVTRQSKLIAPDRKPSFAEWFRFYARLGAMQTPTHAARPAPDGPTWEPIAKVINALETAPYVVEYCDGSFTLHGRGRDAIKIARASKGAKVHFVSMTWRVVGGLTQILPRSDRARGPSAVLAGQGTKFVQHRVATSLTSVRVF